MDQRQIRTVDFMPGYVNNRNVQYMNLGYLSSPFPGKIGQGDYGPRRQLPTVYPTGPYGLDVFVRDQIYNNLPHPRRGSGLNPCFTNALVENR